MMPTFKEPFFVGQAMQYCTLPLHCKKAIGHCQTGVPQGIHIGPVLFIMFIVNQILELAVKVVKELQNSLSVPIKLS